MLRMVERTKMSSKLAIMIRVLAVGGALLLSSLFIMVMGQNPLTLYGAMLEGSFGSSYRIMETLKVTIPIVIASIGIMIAFKMKFWNIGGEGQILMGAFLATFFALEFSYLPKPILLSIMLIAGFVGGGLWALLPGYLKNKHGVNETIVTLMFNYIAIKWITYLQYGPWKDPGAMGFPKIKNFTENAILPKFMGLHIGWIIALVIVVVIAVLLKYSKWGYYINVLGESMDTARYSGIKINKVLLSSVFVSGGICGIVGFIQASAVDQTLTAGLSAGYGFTAIITTWLSSLVPALIIPVSLLFAILVRGGSYIQTALMVPNSAADILQGLILFFVIGSEFFVKYRLVLVKKEERHD